MPAEASIVIFGHKNSLTAEFWILKGGVKTSIMVDKNWPRVRLTMQTDKSGKLPRIFAR